MVNNGGGLIDYGIVGMMLFMTFQYVIKPIVTGFIEKRKKENGTSHNPGPEIHRMLEIMTKTDENNRPLVWGYNNKEAIDRLTSAVNGLTNEIKREKGSL